MFSELEDIVTDTFFSACTLCTLKLFWINDLDGFVDL